MKGKIHFRGEPFTAIVNDRGPELVLCTPLVIETLTDCGLGLKFEDGTGRIWGPALPRDLVLSWRGMEFLRRLKKIEGGTLAYCYYCATRDFEDSDRTKHIGWLIDQIGDKAYEKIMAMPIPEEIVRAMLDGQKDEIKLGLYPITDEVRAGTIKWREEFAAFGIQHPDEVDAEARKDKETLARFENLLASFARSQSMPRECNGMDYVESALLTFVARGAEQEHPMAVIVALSGVVGNLAISEFAMSVIPFGFNAEMVQSQLAKTKEESLVRSAKWLAGNFGRPWWKLWKLSEESFSLESAKRLLGNLLRKHFPESATATA